MSFIVTWNKKNYVIYLEIIIIIIVIIVPYKVIL